MDRFAPHDLDIREQCPSCASTETVALLRHPFDASPIRDFLLSHYCGRARIERLAGAAFEVDRCNGCGLVFQRTVPSPRLLADIYDRWITPRPARRYGLDCYRYVAGQVDFLIQHFRMQPSEIRIFDFGLGWGEWANMARGFGCKVAGAELSEARIEHARSIGIEVIDWDDIPNHRFHFINTEQVFEHLIEPRETLRHLVQALHPDGIIKLSVPNGRGIAGRLKRLPSMESISRDYLMPIQPLEHVNCFDYSSLVELGRRAGLRPLRPSLRQTYNAASGWLEPKQALKNLLRPIFRHVYPKSTFVYFVKNQQSH